MARIKKRYIFSGIFILLTFSLLFFLSTFTKNYIVNHSEELIGRKLEISELHFNYAKVTAQVKDLVLFEDDKQKSFVSFSEMYIDFDPWNLLSNEYAFSEIRLVNPRLQVIQDGEKFNFDSLIPEDTVAVKDTTSNEILKFIVRNIQLVNGEIKYHDLQKDNLIEMKTMNLNLPLIAWNNEQSDMGVEFSMGEKGHVNVQAKVDNVKKKYTVDIKTRDIDIHPITGYMTDYFDILSLEGLLSSHIKMIGDMNEIIDISVSGTGSVNELSVTDGRSEKILTATELFASINGIDLKNFHFGFDKIEAREPRLLVVREKDMTNLEKLLLPLFGSDTIQSSTDTVEVEDTEVTYHIDTMKIDNGLVTIADNTLNRPFKYELNNINVTMTGLSESADQIPVTFSTSLNNIGEMTGHTTWSMTNMMNLEMDAKIRHMDLVSFSPYSEYYIASPITQGWFNYDLSLKMEPTKLINKNNLRVDELEFGKRTKDTTAVKAPVRLGLYIMKDAKDVIAIDLPVSGNPSSPQFKLGKLIWKTFANLMIKTAASPFNMLADLAGTNPESLEKVSFQFAKDSLDKKQQENLFKLAEILKKKPDLIVTLSQMTDPDEEKMMLALRCAKEDYLASRGTDSTKVIIPAALNDDDPELIAYIRNTIPDVDSIGLKPACLKLIKSDRVNSQFEALVARRNQIISELLTVNQSIPPTSVIIATSDLNNLPKEMRKPQFKVEVSVK